MGKIRHILVVAVTLCSFLTDCSGRVVGAVDTVRSGQARIDTFLVHFWDGVDLSDSTLYVMPAAVAEDDGFSAMEEKAAAFFSILPSGSDSVAFRAVKALMDRAVAVSSGIDAYGFFMSAAEKYFYSVQSPYYCEELLLPFLEHKIARTDIPEIEKSREKFLLGLIRRNSVGRMAEDFSLGDGAGSLYGLLGSLSERQSLMIVFFSADCKDCMDGIARLKYSPAVSKKISEDELKVLAVCIEGRLKDVLSEIPSGWFKASDDGSIIRNSVYSIRHQPSIYILDRGGVVILKDADVSSAIQFLLGY
ncbi:MAG: DUF5106 domain-containing protein [Bacteroidales bacterium]|nr:DUF5106 domain-containing protein [Bacteroidales bacterium]